MTTNDELQTARDEYADAQESLSVEPGTEFGQIVVLGNALDAAGELITALEAHAAAQQQRIDALERLNRRANGLLGSCWSLLVHIQHNEGLYRQARPEIEQTVKELEAWNVAQHEAPTGRGRDDGRGNPKRVD